MEHQQWLNFEGKVLQPRHLSKYGRHIRSSLAIKSEGIWGMDNSAERH